jgi:hypothetical protein
MTLWKLYDRERNMHDDSDFFAGVFDDEKNELREELVGSTRWGGGPCIEMTPMSQMPEDIRASYHIALRARWQQHIECAETMRITHPTRPEGQRVVLVKDAHNRPRETVECQKCSGSGHWTNPKNARDVRKCFACDGTGRQTKAAKGKMVKIPSGTKGTCTRAFERQSQYGTWSYGTQCTIRLDDGSEIRASLDSLRLDEEPRLDYVAEQAATRAANGDAYSVMHPGATLALFGR